MIWIPNLVQARIIDPLVRAHLRSLREIADRSAKTGLRKRLRAVVPVMATIAITGLVGAGLFGSDGVIGISVSMLFLIMAALLLLQVVRGFVGSQRWREENSESPGPPEPPGCRSSDPRLPPNTT